MIDSVEGFANYFEGVRRRTNFYLKTIPPNRLDWSPREGEFTCRAIIDHLAATEKMFVGVFVSSKWKYDEHAHLGGNTLDALLAELESVHVQTMQKLRAVPNTELNTQRPTLDGPEIKAWRLLMMLVEHEVHHRSQLAMYLFLMGVQPPHIFGKGVEEVIARATG